MNLLSRFAALFSKPKRIQFIETTPHQIAQQFPNALPDLLNCTRDGFLIKGFLSKEEVKVVLDRFSEIGKHEVSNNVYGFTYPSVFATFFRGYDLESPKFRIAATKYFNECSNLDVEFSQIFGFDIKKRLDEFFRSISGDKAVLVPKGFNGIGSYPFANFRYLKKGGGKIPLHCGNYFQAKLSEVYTHINEMVEVENQLSFFIMLNKPEAGGILDVLSLRWETGQHVPNDVQDTEVVFANGQSVFPDSDKIYNKLEMEPYPGDMILFQGGSLWHRVTEIQGDLPRITFGGFIGRGRDNDIFYWT